MDESSRELMELVSWQLGYGARFPGSAAHVRFREALQNRLCGKFDEFFVQTFSIELRSMLAECSNFIGRIGCRGPRRRGPLLLGTHFDTRMKADREKNKALRNRPIPGANDGGSGTAILLHLLDRLTSRELQLHRDLLFAFFDAEDVGDIEGYPFAVGARVFAAHPVPEMPVEVLILDMVGGADMVLNIDRHISHYPASKALTDEIWALAGKLGIQPFYRQKVTKWKYIVCDHTPFLIKGLPTCVLIDIDYPEWHTLGDLPQAMSGQSMAAIEELLLCWLTDVNPCRSGGPAG